MQITLGSKWLLFAQIVLKDWSAFGICKQKCFPIIYLFIYLSELARERESEEREYGLGKEQREREKQTIP